MCWIYYSPNWTSSSVINALDIQQDRWLQSLWVVTDKNIHFVLSNKTLIVDKLKDYTEEIRKFDINSPVLCHHRKASAGSVSLDNCHPYSFDWFTIMQNWTSKAFWGLIEINSVLGHDDWSDTKEIWHFIETHLERDEDFLDNCVDYFDQWSSEWIEFWIIIMQYWDKVLLWSDWKRPSIIKYWFDWNIESIMNLSSDVSDKNTYSNKWYIIFDFHTWKVLDKDIKETITAPTSTYYSGYNYGKKKTKKQKQQNTIIGTPKNTGLLYTPKPAIITNNEYSWDIQLIVKNIIKAIKLSSTSFEKDMQLLNSMYWLPMYMKSINYHLEDEIWGILSLINYWWDNLWSQLESEIWELTDNTLALEEEDLPIRLSILERLVKIYYISLKNEYIIQTEIGE